MEFLNIKDDQTRNMLSNCIANKTLIPIIGSGFTAGEKSSGGSVPDGDKFRSIMIDAILTSSDELKNSQDALKKREFSQLAEIYLNEKFVPGTIVKENIKKYFSEVSLSKEKKLFIKICWPYVYTLNIDDAIERNSGLTPVLPYKSISGRSREMGCVYKIHGDAIHELLYDDETSLIFSGSQYIRSLIKNESMLLFLKTDLTENNLLFVGCSLRNEIDLLYAIIGNDEPPNPASNRILVSREKPDALTQIDLERYNINAVLLVDDYENFYTEMKEISEERVCSVHNQMEEYLLEYNYVLHKDKNTNINFLLKVESSYKKVPYYLILPYYYADRELSVGIIWSCKNNPVTIVKGRRFSGKSLLLLGIAKKITDRPVFFFPSRMTISPGMIESCLETRNSLIIIDSNVLDYKAAFVIRDNLKKLSELKTNILIACNPAEIDVANYFALSCDEDCYYELSNKPDQSEYEKMNNKLSEIGLINFKKSKTLLDNTYYLSEEYPDRKARIIKHNDFSEKEIMTLLIVAVFEKIYSAVSRVLGMGVGEMKKLSEKLHPLLEIETASTQERHHHSSCKLLSNSKPWLFKVITEYYEKKGVDDTTQVILKLAKLFVDIDSYRYIQQKIIMFDTLNQVFGVSHGGVSALIRTVYEKLQDILSDDPNYWLQRSKSILKLENKNLGDLRDGVDYAKKALNDSKRTKTVINAEFTIALLYGKLCRMEDYAKPFDVAEAVDWFYEAIQKHNYNKDYINSMIEHSRSKRGDFFKLCKYLYGENLHYELLPKRDKVQFLIEYSGVKHIRR